jgi:hypothetical protein
LGLDLRNRRFDARSVPRRVKQIAEVPVEEQLERALEAARDLPMTGLARKLAGASAKEARVAAHALVRAGRAVLVKRGRAEHLACVDGSTLTPGEVTKLTEASARLSAIVKKLDALVKAARPTRARPGYALMRKDADAILRDITAALQTEQAPSEAPADGHARALVLEAAHDLEMEGIGLVYVPELVQALQSRLVRDDVHRALRDAAVRGEVELRPESGLDRLSAEDRAACLVGPSGRLVSYVRVR